MREKPFDPRALDLPGLCRKGVSVSGQAALAAMPRLAAALAAPADGAAAWSAQGELRPVTGGTPETWLHLEATARVPLQCQRCLQLLSEAVAVDRRFRFVAGEDEAARLDEESEDDVLVLQPRLNLLELLEDELILALPLVPRHEVCPQPLPMPADVSVEGPADDEPAPNPFAALAALRGRTPRGDG